MFRYVISCSKNNWLKSLDFPQSFEGDKKYSEEFIFREFTT